MLGLGLALSASLGWGIADFLGGLQARRVALLRVMVLSQGMALGLLLVVVALPRDGPPPVSRLWPAAAGGLAGIAGLTAFYRALSIGKMSIVAPIAATGVLIPVVVGIASGDHPAAIQLLGILAACVGVVLVSRETEHEPKSAGRAGHACRVSALALVAAIGFGSLAVGLVELRRAPTCSGRSRPRGASASVPSCCVPRAPPAAGASSPWPTACCC